MAQSVGHVSHAGQDNGSKAAQDCRHGGTSAVGPGPHCNQ